MKDSPLQCKRHQWKLKIPGEQIKMKERIMRKWWFNKIGSMMKMRTLLSHSEPQESPKGWIHPLAILSSLLKRKNTTKILCATLESQCDGWCLANFAMMLQKNVKDRECLLRNFVLFVVQKSSMELILWCNFWQTTKVTTHLKERCEIFLKIFSRKFWEEHI